MTYFPKRATCLASLSVFALGTTASAQDLASLSALDILKLQIGAGQTAAQLEEQLADQLTFDAADQVANSSAVKSYAQSLASQGMAPGGLSASLPIRELTYDFDQKTYKICLPSSILYKSPTDGGTVEALVSFTFTGLAEKNPDLCPFYKDGFRPGGALGVANYMEIEVDMATAQKLHDAIVADTSTASFSCEEVTYMQGRFDTGPTQLRCAAGSVNISGEGGTMLSYNAGGDDSWITQSSGGDSAADTATAAADTAVSEAEAAAAAALAEAEAAVAEAEPLPPPPWPKPKPPRPKLPPPRQPPL